MTAIDQLQVIWGEPNTGGRHVIGHLARAEGTFRFWYAPDLTAARARGFQLLPEFPVLRGIDEPYVERYLFALFAERIPSPSRADAKAMMASWGVEHPDDQFEVLARSGGIRATDRLELAEHRDTDDQLERPLELRIAGRRHITDAAALSIGDAVSLRAEHDNVADPAAVIVDRDAKRAGYVPRQYTALVGRLLDQGVAITGSVVRQLVVPDDVGRWVVRISRRAREASH